LLRRRQRLDVSNYFLNLRFVQTAPQANIWVSEIHGNGHANIEELGMINTNY
jgi:hypothetical protein